jgi:uncharacterized protein YjbI with pentapeptide repeats
MPPEWLDKVTNFISSFTTFLDDTNDKELIKYLKGGSGFFSLAIEIVQMYNNYKEAQKTPYEKSISTLFSFLFKFIYDQVNTIIIRKSLDAPKLSFKTKKDFKNELENFFSVYKTGAVTYEQLTDPYLPSHPLIEKFKNKTMEWLISKGYSRDIIDILNQTFEFRIESDLYNDPELKDFREIAKQDLIENGLIGYLDEVIKEYHHIINLEKDFSPISNFTTIYVNDRKAIRLNIRDDWHKTDLEIYRDHNDNIKNIDEIINDFLYPKKENNLYNGQRLIIGSPYGVGKTTLIIKLMYDLAKSKIKSAREYVPILIRLKNGLDHERGGSRHPIDGLLKLIFKDFDTTKKIDNPVLLILDALDEYPNKSPSVMDLVKDPEPFKNFSNIKIIYTTRLNDEFQELSQFEDEYIRLLPFNMSQVNSFFAKRSSELTYKKLQENHLDEEIITKPLILSILIKSLPVLETDFNRLSEKGILTKDLSKTLIYMEMFYDQYFGKFRNTNRKENTNRKQHKNMIGIPYQRERDILRKISYYSQIKNNLTVKELKDWSKQIDIKIEELQPVINTYFLFTKQDEDIDEDNNKQISFLHQTYKEFLLAEYLIEQYLNGNTLGLNIGRPSEVTINFFKGFLDLLNSDNKSINKFVIGEDNNNKNTLLYSLDYKPKSQQNQLKEIKEKMTNIAKESFNNDLVNLLEIEHQDEIRSSFNSNKLKRYQSIQSEVNKYENLWLHRWLSLITLVYLDKEIIKELENKKFENLILFNSHNVPNYIKYLCYANLSHANLSNANLSHANLSNANLSHTKLTYADLSNANLSSAELFSTNLSHANLSNAKLTNATLTDANLSNANLSNADLFSIDLTRSKLYSAELFSTNLSNAKLTDAKFTDANLSNAKLIDANLSDAKLSNAKIIDANLSNANLSHAKIIGADLSHSKIIDANLSDAKLITAKFHYANLSYSKLSRSNLSHTNLSRANLSNVDLSYANLSYANLSNVDLSYANLSNAKLANTIIININRYDNIILNQETDFDDSIIDDKDFIKKLEENTCQNIPNIIPNKKVLREKLKEKRFDELMMNYIVNKSKLSEN